MRAKPHRIPSSSCVVSRYPARSRGRLTCNTLQFISINKQGNVLPGPSFKGITLVLRGIVASLVFPHCFDCATAWRFGLYAPLTTATSSPRRFFSALLSKYSKYYVYFDDYELNKKACNKGRSSKCQLLPSETAAVWVEAARPPFSVRNSVTRPGQKR